MDERRKVKQIYTSSIYERIKMFTKQELELIAQVLANAQVAVGNAKPASALLDKIIELIKKEPTEK